MVVLAACHIHSDWSYDGKWSLSELASEFGRRGFRVVMMTEHDRGFTEDRRRAHREECARASSDTVLLLPGIEYSDAANTVHVLVWGDVPFLGEALPTLELLDKVKAAGGLAVMAHPTRRKAWQRFHPSWAGGLLAIEIWNRKTDGWAPSRTASTLISDSGLPCFAGMDFHTRHQMFPLSMALDLAEEPSEQTILDSLREGRFKACAFGMSLDRSWVRRSFFVLKPAEWGRRLLAGVYRRRRSWRKQ